jgi:hypothetical protein
MINHSLRALGLVALCALAVTAAPPADELVFHPILNMTKYYQPIGLTEG